MKRLGILTIQFYRLLLLYNIAFSITVTFLFLVGLGQLNVGSFLPIKILGFLSAAGLHYYLSKESYFYFRNAGCSVKRLFYTAFAFDILIYFVLVILYLLAQHAAAYFKS